MPEFTTGDPVAERDRRCEVCRTAPPPFRRAVAYGVYQEEMRSFIHLLKYDGIVPVADGLGRLLASTIATLHAEAPNDLLVVPVPLFAAKQHQRGYNQAALLAISALDILHTTHRQWKLQLSSSALMRRKATESQAGLSSHQRRGNVRGAFFVPQPRKIVGRDVLLIDDIYTTGATARECSKALLAAGAVSVWVATLARAQREGVAKFDSRTIVVADAAKLDVREPGAVTTFY
jgi:ComF family protein